MSALSEQLRALQAAEPRTNVASCARFGAFTQAAELAEAYELGNECQAQCEKLESENAALTKRVAALESQLTWTPVSAGLPTEPGFYLFEHPDCGLTLYECVESELYPWRNIAGARHRPDVMARRYERFRRIELPEAS